MQPKSGNDVKACQVCGVLNYIPDSEMELPTIQCDACGQDIPLDHYLIAAHTKRKGILSRKNFSQTIFSMLLFLASPLWSKIFENLFERNVNHGKEKNVERRPRPIRVTPDPVQLKFSVKAASVFTAEVKRLSPPT